MRTTALFVASLAACASALSTTKNQRAPSLALKGESTAALKEQLRRTAAPTQNGVGASERTVLTVEAIAAELEPAGSRRVQRRGASLSTSTGASSGKLGPFVGHVTQTFLDEKTFVNAVELGPLKVALTARREPLDMSGWTYRVTFESMGLSLFGVEVGSKPISGGGTWNIRYVDDDLRIMDAPSLFVLSRRRDTAKSPTLLDVLDDPAKFMEDDD
ncbi:PAP fibrillin [Aureococcus anophagefferens]|nr:PAP fibrillin [Aureococcus anophagefferens]